MNVLKNSKAKHPRSHALDYSICPFLPCDATSFLPLCLGTCLFVSLFLALTFYFLLKKQENNNKMSRKYTKGCTRELNMHDFLMKNDAGLPLMIPLFEIQ